MLLPLLSKMQSPPPVVAGQGKSEPDILWVSWNSDEVISP
jgi:hypothetical protein